ncbi:MAG: hypothetical protein H6Q12_84 [Bacteroidetes bacterium]|nr:hypothetical protein [Bacteroidota bacterium]
MRLFTILKINREDIKQYNMINIFVIKWIGPFFSIEDLKEWEKFYNQDYIFNFYIITGKLKGKRLITKYCGITDTQRGYIHSRFYDKKHKVQNLSRETNIWIGCLTDQSLRTRENLELCETMIISFWQPEENTKKRAYYPSNPMVLINRWFDTKNKLRINAKYPSQELSDVIIYDELNKGIYGTERLKKLVNIA